MPSPSNADLMKTLGRIEEKVDAVGVQATKTNGRVSTIENWKNAIEAVEAYKEKHSGPVATTKEGNIVVTPPATYWASKEKLFGALAVLATTAATALGILYGASQ